MHTGLFRRITSRPTRMPAVVAGLVLTASLGAAPAAAAPRAAAPARYPGAVTNLTGHPQAVTVISPSDAWAAQGFDVMLHWNGTTWSKVPITNDGTGVQFNSVSGDSPSDVWTVGETFGGAPVLEHWNGTAWTKAANPAGLPGSVGLLGVSTVSRSDAWAVGSTSGAFHSVILHWNGAKWSRVGGPHARDASLASVTALSASDAWAVGSYGPGARHQLVLHWNGTTWSQVAIPQIAGLDLISISADSASDAWAAGWISTTSSLGTVTVTVALHWNGSTWSRVAAPSPNRTKGAVLADVDAVSPTLAFAVGFYNTYPVHGGGGEHADTLLLQWNGSTWTRVPSPSLGSSFGPGSFLAGVAASSPSNAWAVGSYHIGGIEAGNDFTLMMRWNGNSWTRG